MNETTASRSPHCVWHEGQPLGAYIVRVARILEDRLDSSLAEVGLSAAKLTVLSQLVAADEPLALGSLAVRLSCVRSNVTQIVDRMESDGLVRRIDDPADRRAVRAELTPLGRERQAEGARRLATLEEEMRGRLSEEERDVLVEVLAKLA